MSNLFNNDVVQTGTISGNAAEAGIDESVTPDSLLTTLARVGIVAGIAVVSGLLYTHGKHRSETWRASRQFKADVKKLKETAVKSETPVA